MYTDSVNGHLRRAWLLDFNAKRAHRCERSQAVLTGQETTDLGPTFGDTAKH
jgi:hypothetical protein